MSKVFTSEKIKSYLESKFNSYSSTISRDLTLDDLLSGIDELTTESTDNWALYTNRDAQDIRNFIVEKISTLTDQWTDFNESDVGATIIELLAGFADYLGFYLDKQSLECFLPSVKQRKNGVGVLNLINYKMRMTNSCVTNGRFVFPEVYAEDIEIPKYLEVSAVMQDNTKIFYATKKPALLKAGLQIIDIPLIQGRVAQSRVRVSDLKASNKFRLAVSNIASGSMELVIDGVTWEEVPDVLLDDVPGPKYSFYESKNCEPMILFHNSYKDYLPNNDSAEAVMTYLVSLGAEGKIKEGVISRVESSFMINGVEAKDKIEVTNTEVSSGGSERETLDEARVQAPKTLSTLGKAIILQDYEDLTLGLPGVLKCKALDWSVEGEYVSTPWIVDLYIIPTDGGVCSDTQLSEIENYFNNGVKMSPIKVNAKNAVTATIDISVIVESNVVGSIRESALRKTIESAIRNKFNPKNLNFGDKIGKSTISNWIQECSDAIGYVEVELPDTNLSLGLNQFPVLGNISIIIRSN